MDPSGSDAYVRVRERSAAGDGRPLSGSVWPTRQMVLVGIGVIRRSSSARPISVADDLAVDGRDGGHVEHARLDAEALDSSCRRLRRFRVGETGITRPRREHDPMTPTAKPQERAADTKR
jgi:hypothetical protein